MFIRSLTITLSFILCFNPAAAFADETKECNTQQTKRCEHFCSRHNGFKSCVIDIEKRSGTCTCQDGTSHSK